MTPLELTAVAGIISAVIGAVAVIIKIKPERDSLIITQTQGAATILNDLVDTLREELTRSREENSQLRKRNAELEKENQGLRRRHGTRKSDRRV